MNIYERIVKTAFAGVCSFIAGCILLQGVFILLIPLFMLFGHAGINPFGWNGWDGWMMSIAFTNIAIPLKVWIVFVLFLGTVYWIARVRWDEYDSSRSKAQYLLSFGAVLYLQYEDTAVCITLNSPNAGDKDQSSVL